VAANELVCATEPSQGWLRPYLRSHPLVTQAEMIGLWKQRAAKLEAECERLLVNRQDLSSSLELEETR
jgi:hypothetical protein